MIAEGPTQAVAYAQLGQENSFGWPRMREAYPMQMNMLAREQKEKGLLVETLSETGRRFKNRFSSTPTQAQVMLEDPFGHKHDPERTVWYQSKYLRANLHFRGDFFYIRDLQVYSDNFAQLYLKQPTRLDTIEHRTLAVLDGYHWSDKAALAGRSGIRAMGRFVVVEKNDQLRPLAMKDRPIITQSGSMLRASVPLSDGGQFVALFDERSIAFGLKGVSARGKIGLNFEWVPEQAAFKGLSENQLNYQFRGFNYSVRVENGVASRTKNGVKITSSGNGLLRLQMAQ